MNFIRDLTSLAPNRMREKINELIAAMRKLNLTAGSGIKLDEHPNGTVISSMTTAAGVGSSPAEYDGPFALTYDEENRLIHVSSGYLNANGQWFEVDEAEISPQTGVICVNCELNEGEWTSPEIIFDTPGTNSFPIGRCTVNDDSVEVESFHTPVAIIIETTTCPYDEGGGGGGGDDPI